MLHFGAFLRAWILDTFGGLLYIYYDDFSIAEVEALHKVYQEIFERRYDIFDLVPDILKNAENMRPSIICAGIYAHAKKSCLRSSANVCRKIRKQHNLPHPEDLNTPTFNVTHMVYRFSKISKQYPSGFSLTTVLKLLQREALIITPALLSGLLYNVRYDDFDDDVRFAEKKLIRYFHELITRKNNTGILKPMPTQKLKKLHTVDSFLKHYINIQTEKFLDHDLKKYSLLIAKRIVYNDGKINENIHLLSKVYENRMIHVEYLFNLVLPDDILDNDVIEAKKYLVRKLDEFDVIEKYLKVQRYQQATPGQLIMEITGQLKDIDFAKDIATSLRIHAKFWRRSIIIENLDELLELFDAYENLRQIPQYKNMTQNIDRIKKNLRNKKNVTVEILCHAPRGCLRIGLQSILQRKLLNPEIKKLIKTFLETSVMCTVTVKESAVDISTQLKEKNTMWIEKTTIESMISKVTTSQSTTEAYNESKTTTDSSESESTEEVPGKPDIPLNSSEFTSTTTTATTLPTTVSKTNPILTMTMGTTVSQEETIAASTVATTTISSVTTAAMSPTTTTMSPTTILLTKEVPITEELNNSITSEDKLNGIINSTTISCESNECTTEQNSKETTEPIETTTIISLPTTSTQPFIVLETEIQTRSSVSSSTLANNSTETTVTKELSKTLITKGEIVVSCILLVNK